MLKDLLPTLKPHLLAVVIFFGLTFAYFYPAYQGYKLKQGDTKNWMGMSHEVVNYRNTTGEQSLWTNSMFGGMPAYQISTVYADYVLRGIDKVFTLFIPNVSKLFFLYLISFYLMGLLLGWDYRVAIVGAVAFAFSTYFIVILEAGHNSKAHAIGYMPLVFGAYYKLWNSRKKLLYGGLFALALALEIWCNHVQITYYLGMLLGIYSVVKLVQAIQEKETQGLVKTIGFAAVATVLAVAANIASLYSTYEYGKSTTRGGMVLTIKPNGEPNDDIATSGLDRDYVVQWSYGLQESFTLLVPNAKGGATRAIGTENDALRKAPRQYQQSLAQSNSYWGNQAFTSGPVYVGAIVILLFLYACFWVKGALKWVFIATTVLALMLSWGKNFMGLTDFFLDYIPGYNKFRAVTIVLSLLEFTIPVLAFFGLQKILKQKPNWEDIKKPYYIASGIVSGLLLLFWFTPQTFFTFVSDAEMQSLNQQAAQGNAAQIQAYIDALKQVRVAIFQKDVLRSIGFVVFGALAVQAFFRGWIKKSWHLVAILGVLILADLWPVNKRYLNTDKVRGQYENWERANKAVVAAPPAPYDIEILQRELQQNPDIQPKIQDALLAARKEKGQLSELEQAKTQFAVLNLNTNYRVLNMARNTFNDAFTSYYHKSIGGYHGAKLRRYQDLIEFHFSGGLNFQVLNMLNTKYIIQNQGGQPRVIPNQERFGNAWFVSSIKPVANANEAIQALDEEKSNLRYEAVVNTADYPAYADYRVSIDSTATIQLTDYLPNRLVYNSNASSKQFAVFSEIFFQPGWQAYMDGEPVEHIRVNYLLRGMEIPAGEHEIVFEFAPAAYDTGNTVNIAASILIVLLLGAGVYKQARTED